MSKNFYEKQYSQDDNNINMIEPSLDITPDDTTTQDSSSHEQKLSPQSGIVMEIYNNGFRPKVSKNSIDPRIKKYLLYILFFFGCYLLGFLYFMLTLEYTPEFPTTRTDAIITLTGETKRITDSIEELSKNYSPRLFISGVHRQAPIEKVIDKTIQKLKAKGKITANAASTMKSRIETGRAENTIENALESAEWVKKNKISSIRVITSFYHQPRVKLLFEKYLPNTTKIYHPITFANIGHNVFKEPKTFPLLLSEYNKYLLTYLWNLSGVETNSNTFRFIQGVINQ